MKYVVKDLIRIIPRQGIQFHETITSDLRAFAAFFKILPKVSDCEYISFKDKKVYIFFMPKKML